MKTLHESHAAHVAMEIVTDYGFNRPESLKTTAQHIANLIDRRLKVSEMRQAIETAIEHIEHLPQAGALVGPLESETTLIEMLRASLQP